MPQARAAVRQTGGRTPLGLVLPGKTLLIVVGEIREPQAQHDGAGGDQARHGGAWRQGDRADDVGAARHHRGRNSSRCATALRENTISDGQRELEYFFTGTGLMREARARAATGSRRTIPISTTPPGRVPKIDDPTLAKLAAEYSSCVPKALVAWLDKNPGVDWVVWRRGGRGNTRKLLDHHGDEVSRQLHLFRSLRPDEPGAGVPLRRVAPGRDQDHRVAGLRRSRRGHRSGRHRVRLRRRARTSAKALVGRRLPAGPPLHVPGPGHRPLPLLA